MPMSFGPEWFVVLGVLVLLFGAKKLPELARSLGKSSNEFKRGLKEGSEESSLPDPRTEPRSDAAATSDDAPPSRA
jgi:sec-independent protein translocase protein TatA